MLEALVDGIWTEEAPQKFIGLDMGTRMVVVRLGDGDLLLYASIAATEARRAAVAELGPVRVVVCPNRFHHLYAGEWTAHYPEAELWAPRGLAKKRPDLKIDHVLGEEAPPWSGDCQPIPLEGVSELNEFVLWHPATRSLIGCDLFQNYTQAPGGLWTKLYFALSGLTGGPGVSRMIRFAYRDRAKARASVDRMLSLDPARIVVAHGAIVTKDATSTLRHAFEWLRG